MLINACLKINITHLVIFLFVVSFSYKFLAKISFIYMQAFACMAVSITVNISEEGVCMTWCPCSICLASLRKVLPHHNNWRREKGKSVAHIAITLPSRRLLRQERQFITLAYLSYWCASVISNHF